MNTLLLFAVLANFIGVSMTVSDTIVVEGLPYSSRHNGVFTPGTSCLQKREEQEMGDLQEQ